MHDVYLFLLFLAACCLIASAFRVRPRFVDLEPLGLFFMVLVFLISSGSQYLH